MHESLRKLRNDRRYEKSMQYSDFYPPPPPPPPPKKTHAESYLLSTQYYGIVDFLLIQSEDV